MAGVADKKDHLSHEMGMHTEGLLGRTQQRFFNVAEDSGSYRYPDAPDVDFNKRAEIDCAEFGNATNQCPACVSFSTAESELSFCVILDRSIRSR